MHHSSFEQLVARFEDPLRASWQKPEAVLDLIEPLAGKTVADIGAGTGYFSVLLAKRRAHVLAIDVDSRFVDYVRNRASNDPNGKLISPRLASGDHPQLDPDSIDIALLIDVYHHIEHREGYFKQVLRALRPDGSVVVVDFKGGDNPVGPPDALKVPADQVVAELGRAGFVLPTVDTTTLPYQYIVRMRVPSASRAQADGG
jgi:SAM-dependent methyltransferase